MSRRFGILGACLAGLVLAAASSSGVDAAEKWGPFRGQIVDAETGQPIPGAVVLVVWWEAVHTPVQTNRKFHEAREAVTDSEGRFEIPRLKPPFFSFRIFQPQVGYFAAGYLPVAEVVTPPDGQPFVAPTVLKMRRLKTREELLAKRRSWSSRIPPEKMIEFIKAVNAEREMLGLGSLPIIPPQRKDP